MSDAPELDGLVDRKTRNIATFRDEQEGMWAVVNLAYLASRSLVTSTAAFGAKSATDLAAAHRLMMWYTVIDYQMESFFLMVDRRLGAGLALLRMASPDYSRGVN